MEHLGPSFRAAVSRPGLMRRVTWAALPWLFYIMLRACREGWRFWRIAPAVFVVLFLGSAGFVHAYLPALFLLVAIFGLFLWIFRSQEAPALGSWMIFAVSVGL